MKKIVYILSSNFSGSHLLSCMIGSHSRFVHIGEVKNVAKKTDKMLCPTCEDLDQCPVLKGINRGPVDKVYDTIFNNVGEGVLGLVDTSKRMSWISRAYREHNYKIHCIHLIRDPRALVRRWLMTQPQQRPAWRERVRCIKSAPEFWSKFLKPAMSDVYTYKWLIQNHKITSYLDHHNMEHSIVTYYDLMHDSRKVLEKVMAACDADYEPNQEEYWRHVHHGSKKYQYEILQQGQELRFDMRWKDYLHPDVAQRIFKNRDVNRYLALIGIHFKEEGLTSFE